LWCALFQGPHVICPLIEAELHVNGIYACFTLPSRICLECSITDCPVNCLIGCPFCFLPKLMCACVNNTNGWWNGESGRHDLTCRFICYPTICFPCIVFGYCCYCCGNNCLHSQLKKIHFEIVSTYFERKRVNDLERWQRERK
jgi:hypothetical protein